MREYQIIKKPIATATGERGQWSFVALGATYPKAEADVWIAESRRFGYIGRKLAI